MSCCCRAISGLLTDLKVRQARDSLLRVSSKLLIELRPVHRARPTELALFETSSSTGPLTSARCEEAGRSVRGGRSTYQLLFQEEEISIVTICPDQPNSNWQMVACSQACSQRACGTPATWVNQSNTKCRPRRSSIPAVSKPTSIAGRDRVVGSALGPSHV